jgi:hypothetical protein
MSLERDTLQKGRTEKKVEDGGLSCSDAVVGHSAAASELFFISFFF